MSKVIVVDAGHGGTDPGAVNGGRLEKDDALRLALAVREELARMGQTVIMTRTDDTYPTLAQRTAKANAAGADLYLSLHRNSHTTAGANGVEVWVYLTAGSAEEAAAAQVMEQLAGVGVQSNRGVKKGNYHVLRETRMLAMLVELGFISNAEDNRLFDNRFSEYARAVARGACLALGEDCAQDEPETGSLYRVQVGAFAQRENAESFLNTVRGLGLEAFLVAPAQGKE